MKEALQIQKRGFKWWRAIYELFCETNVALFMQSKMLIIFFSLFQVSLHLLGDKPYVLSYVTIVTKIISIVKQ